MTTQREP